MPTRSCSRSVRPTSRAGLLPGFPGQQQRQPHGVGDAVGSRTQLYSLVALATVVLAMLSWARCWPRSRRPRSAGS